MWKKILLVLSLCLFSLLACSEPNETHEPSNDKTLSQEAMVPNITTQPQLSNYYFVNNQFLELSIDAVVTDNGTLTYQWYKNNELIKEATSCSYQEKLSVTENADVQYFCEVTNSLGVTEKSVKSQVVTIHLIKDIYFQTDSYTLQIGKSQIVGVMAVGKIEWKSSDENIVKVENGEITAIATGKATVTAIFKDFADMSKTWEIIVNDKVNAQSPKCEFMYNKQEFTLDGSSFFVKGGKLLANAETDDNGTLNYRWFVNDEFADVTTATCDVTKPGFYL